MIIFLLFIIACAVAPEAIINICRFVEWLAKAAFYVGGGIAAIAFFGYATLGIYHRLFT